jgi:uncharacterized protein (TIGR03086 family)
MGKCLTVRGGTDTLCHMSAIPVDRLLTAQAEFAGRLALVRAGDWHRPTPCAAWDVRALTNHVVLGELGYLLLLAGGSGAEFLAMQTTDALGEDPVGAYAAASTGCRAAFAEPGAAALVVDYPLGAVRGAQLLDLRATETLVHAWDLARAIGVDETLDPELVAWAYANLAHTYLGIAESPVEDDTDHVFFAEPRGPLPAAPSIQDRLIHLTGRVPA